MDLCLFSLWAFFFTVGLLPAGWALFPTNGFNVAMFSDGENRPKWQSIFGFFPKEKETGVTGSRGTGYIESDGAKTGKVSYLMDSIE
ncbi:hypothetical protein V8C35DRAFT_15455 [Trichoderma chlorosporum]